jgi:hypothetical protein
MPHLPWLLVILFSACLVCNGHRLSYITTFEFSNLECTGVVSYYDYENLVSVRFGLYHEVDVCYQILTFKYSNFV